MSSPPVPSTCEVQIEGRWRAVGLNDAYLEYRGAIKRCPACHGRIDVQRSFTFGKARLSIVHRKLHLGCPSARRFAGQAVPHPEALA